ncbi:HTH domain-containing protein [Dysgonomonas sp. OttesenSCG-928-M03]|nr:HTH domain-containing protein [Dysgonomonas sp. OttesenSCG-928-M03]
MTVQKYIDRMNYLCKLIENESTGTPEELAEKLSVSKRQMFNLINNLKDMGAEIKYNRVRATYYFINDFEMVINVEIRVSDDQNV